jgi:uncharacterized protein YciW
MASRTFQLRLRSSHAGPELTSQSVVVERLSEGGIWQPQSPSLGTPPFRLYLLSLLLCLQFHLLAEARERGLPLRQVRADLTATVAENWDLEALAAHFQLRLDPGAEPEQRGQASPEVLDALVARMRLSPVPRNRPAAVPLSLEVGLDV